MKPVRNYKIPGFGEFIEFSIYYYDKAEVKKIEKDMGKKIEPGYYGFHGARTLTKRSNTLKEAEGVLVKEILEMMTKQEKIHSRRLEELSKLISEVSSPGGISKYLVG